MVAKDLLFLTSTPAGKVHYHWHFQMRICVHECPHKHLPHGSRLDAATIVDLTSTVGPNYKQVCLGTEGCAHADATITAEGPEWPEAAVDLDTRITHPFLRHRQTKQTLKAW
eukprot:573135-Pelagomonas_calceolata.AAC.8